MAEQSAEVDDILVPAIGDSKLRDLGWSLNVKKEGEAPKSFKPET